LLVAISITTFFVDGLRWSAPAFSVFLGFITLLYFHKRETKIAGPLSSSHADSE
jgi:hypothetical protein